MFKVSVETHVEKLQITQSSIFLRKAQSNETFAYKCIPVTKFLWNTYVSKLMDFILTDFVHRWAKNMTPTQKNSGTNI